MKPKLENNANSKPVFSIKFPAIVEFVVPLRKAFISFLEIKKVPHELSYMLTLGMSEAVINVIEHTYKFDASKWVVVEWMLEEIEGERELVVTIRDFGKKVDPSSLTPRPLDKLEDHGLGLHLIKKAFDVVEFDQNVAEGNLLRLVKKL
ncbi:MAG: serine/threonine-protein kinase RsbW [Thermotogota bacterium]|nr:serine/threonine-protein kinase RsbW [Thermotogota bacterium]MDK2864818.1 serine/threonine-protein kinase RsbW [Thermotogota bacterium]HCZ06458.1 ATP-binding protein [Thermotogota bacterium]